MPQSSDDWMKIAKEFDTKWNFPHTLGALDGKHIALRAPHHAGSKYYNYKNFHSIVLMALVDADYKFINIDVGCNGRISDGGVFAGCSLSEALNDAIANVPADAPLPDDEETIMSFHLVGDDAFPLKTWLMKPLPFRNLTPEERIYNYRLSRARRVVENAFGILAKFRVFLSTMIVTPERAERIVLAAYVLHNYLRCSADVVTSRVIDDEDSSDQTARQNAPLGLRPAKIAHSNFTGYEAREKRQQLVGYFAEKGAVSWQNDMV